MSTTTRNHRARWAAIGAAIAVSVGAGGIGLANATSPDGASAFVPIEACRILDTRPNQNIGAKTGGFGPTDTHTIQTRSGNTGQCNPLPAGITGVALNVTAIGASTLTHLTFWASGPVPNSSSLNPAPGQPPTPNAVTTEVADDGSFNVFNFAGNLQLIIDVVGYYTDHHHDDRYYTKGQSDDRDAATDHDHDDRHYTKGQSDDRYATIGHNHDGRYYTKGQADAALATKAARTETIIIPSSAFRAVTTATEVEAGNIFGAYVTGGSGTSLRAPLSLPVGSTITSITYHYRDAAAAHDLSLGMSSTVLGSNTQGPVPGVAFTTAGTPGNASHTIGGLSIVVSSTSELALSAFANNWSAANSTLTVKGVTITYTKP